MFDLQGLNIYLIGMMGAGKSTIGKLLAANSDYAFLDTDDFVLKFFNQYEEQEGTALSPDIPTIFTAYSEPEFRNIETNVLAEVSAHTRLIVATGGGVPIARKNWHHLHQGCVIWIDPSVEILVERLQDDATRPILATPEALHPKLTRILAERSHMYAEADLRISFTDDLLPETVADRILAAIPTVLRTPIAIPD